MYYANILVSFFQPSKSRSHSILLLEHYFPSHSHSLRRNSDIHVVNIQWNFYSTFSLWCYDVHNISNEEEGRNLGQRKFYNEELLLIVLL